MISSIEKSSIFRTFVSDYTDSGVGSSKSSVYPVLKEEVADEDLDSEDGEDSDSEGEDGDLGGLGGDFDAEEGGDAGLDGDLEGDEDTDAEEEV